MSRHTVPIFLAVLVLIAFAEGFVEAVATWL